MRLYRLALMAPAALMVAGLATAQASASSTPNKDPDGAGTDDVRGSVSLISPPLEALSKIDGAHCPTLPARQHETKVVGLTLTVSAEHCVYQTIVSYGQQTIKSSFPYGTTEDNGNHFEATGAVYVIHVGKADDRVLLESREDEGGSGGLEYIFNLISLHDGSLMYTFRTGGGKPADQAEHQYRSVSLRFKGPVVTATASQWASDIECNACQNDGKVVFLLDGSPKGFRVVSAEGEEAEMTREDFLHTGQPIHKRATLRLTLASGPQDVDFSGLWFTSTNDSNHVSCSESPNVLAHLVSINNGVNPVHIHLNGNVVNRVSFGNGNLSVDYFRSNAECVASLYAKIQSLSTVDVQRDN